MRDPMEDYEVEALESPGLEEELGPEEREALQEALSGSLEIFRAPAEAEPDYVLCVIETLEELHPYFSDARICDGIGEVIELLHEISEERVLDFHDVQEGKLTVEALAQALESSFTILKFDEGDFDDAG